jgi:hypothetical protein
MASMRVIAFEDAGGPAVEQPVSAGTVDINDVDLKEFPLSAQKALVRLV